MIADNTTKTITMFRGETGTLTMAIDGAELDPEVDRVIFTASKDDNGKQGRQRQETVFFEGADPQRERRPVRRDGRF